MINDKMDKINYFFLLVPHEDLLLTIVVKLISICMTVFSVLTVFIEKENIVRYHTADLFFLLYLLFYD